MPKQLDLSNKIVTPEGRATAYLEDVFFLLFQATNPVATDVSILSGVATVDLSKGSQFNIVADDHFVIDVIGMDTRADNDFVIDIENPGGVFQLTDITAPAGVTVYKESGSSISILGDEFFVFQMFVPTDSKIQVVPIEMEAL